MKMEEKGNHEGTKERREREGGMGGGVGLCGGQGQGVVLSGL